MSERSKKFKSIFKEFNTFLNEFSIEMRDRNCAIVCGVIGVDTSTDTEVVLRIKSSEKLKISGEMLCCDSYGNGAVVIRGRVLVIEFAGVGYDKK